LIMDKNVFNHYLYNLNLMNFKGVIND
jgi:hypothetical protein